tara:strand:- start:954 stop:1220 length:267 start_codon:yes stop_codon:yes gene_type:complete
MTSNLSKIKPKLRTTGNVTGNFGRPKTRAGSTLSDIGLTKKDNIKVALKSEYIKRLYVAFDRTDDKRLKQFIFTQIRDYLIQTGEWES